MWQMRVSECKISQKQESSCNRVSRRHHRGRSKKNIDEPYRRNRNIKRKNEDQMSSKANHTRIPAVRGEERYKYSRSANVQKRELRDGKIRISLAMDAEDRYHIKRLGYTKFCMHERHGIPLVKITLNRKKRHVTVDGPIVIKTR